MSHGKLTLHCREVRITKYLVNEAKIFSHQDGLAIANCHASALLPTMLQGKETKVGQAGDIASRRKDAKDAALVVQRVVRRPAFGSQRIGLVHLVLPSGSGFLSPRRRLCLVLEHTYKLGTAVAVDVVTGRKG